MFNPLLLVNGTNFFMLKVRNSRGLSITPINRTLIIGIGIVHHCIHQLRINSTDQISSHFVLGNGSETPTQSIGTFTLCSCQIVTLTPQDNYCIFLTFPFSSSISKHFCKSNILNNTLTRQN